MATDAERATVYLSLLRGLANEAQDRLCAEDRNHAWSPWTRTMLRKDTGPLRFDPREPLAINEVCRVKAERHCLNCGKSEVS